MMVYENSFRRDDMFSFLSRYPNQNFDLVEGETNVVVISEDFIVTISPELTWIESFNKRVDHERNYKISSISIYGAKKMRKYKKHMLNPEKFVSDSMKIAESFGMAVESSGGCFGGIPSFVDSVGIGFDTSKRYDKRELLSELEQSFRDVRTAHNIIHKNCLEIYNRRPLSKDFTAMLDGEQKNLFEF